MANDPETSRLTGQALSLCQAGRFYGAEKYYRKALRLLAASGKPRDALKYCLVALQGGTVDPGRHAAVRAAGDS